MQLNPFRKNKPPKPDEELVSDYRRSMDMDVLGELYARYMSLTYGVCLRYLGERESAQDAVIQIFEKLTTEVSRHEISNFKSWLYVLAKNHCLMELRRQKPHARVGLNDEKDAALLMENELTLHPIDEEEHQRNEEALNACIEKLKSEQQSCIRLFYFEDKSYREISLALAMDEKKVKSYIQNGKRNLKICLERNS